MRPGLTKTRVAAAILCVLCLAGLTAAVRSGITMPLDLGVNASFAPIRTPWVLAAFVWLTALGTGVCEFGIALAASALVWSFGRGRLVLPLWTTFLGAEATTWAMKFLVDRSRPTFLPGAATASSPSFPSAHATATMAVIGMLGWLIFRQRPDRGGTIALAAGIVIGLIGMSRLVLNVHYPTDVLSGFLVGGTWLLIGSSLADAAAPQRRE